MQRGNYYLTSFWYIRIFSVFESCGVRMLRVFSMIFCLIAMWSSAQAGESAKNPLTIMPLRESDIDYGCGCSFHYPPRLEAKGKAVVQWGIDGPANIRLNNYLYKLSVEHFGLL